MICDMVASKPILAQLNTSLGETGINIRTKQLSPVRGVAMVYAMESDAYFEQLTFSRQSGVWILHRVDQGTRSFESDHVQRSKCTIEPRYWLGFEEKAKVLYDIRPK